ncbi:flagellar assembly protein FliX [Acetobacteraceae bacterium H6797]|nr:flagellar assembly protein FliX [Acetobacteraceae bacterium H6797]
MTRIGGIGAGQPARAASGPRRAGGGFSLPGEARMEETGGAEAVSAVAVMPLPGRREGAPGRDERAKRRGRDLLEGLEAMQKALLLGRDEPGVLDRVARLCEGEPAEDPELDRILQEIVLRARIELVRRNHVSAE